MLVRTQALLRERERVRQRERERERGASNHWVEPKKEEEMEEEREEAGTEGEREEGREAGREEDEEEEDEEGIEEGVAFPAGQSHRSSRLHLVGHFYRPHFLLLLLPLRHHHCSTLHIRDRSNRVGPQQLQQARTGRRRRGEFEERSLAAVENYRLTAREKCSGESACAASLLPCTLSTCAAQVRESCVVRRDSSQWLLMAFEFYSGTGRGSLTASFQGHTQPSWR